MRTAIAPNGGGEKKWGIKSRNGLRSVLRKARFQATHMAAKWVMKDEILSRRISYRNEKAPGLRRKEFLGGR